MKLARIGLAALAVLTVSYASLFYIVKASFSTSSKDLESLGQLGDAFGGLLNPMIGIFTLVMLILTLKSQQDELIAQRNELQMSREIAAAQNRAIALQSFEQSFFSWLRSYKEMVAAFQFTTSQLDPTVLQRSITLAGPPALAQAIKEAFQFERDDTGSKGYLYTNSFWDSDTRPLDYPERKELADDLVQNWRALVKDRDDLNSILDTLFKLIEWIDSRPADTLGDSERMHYVEVILSQATRAEQRAILAHGLGDDRDKIANLISKYALLRDLSFLEDDRITQILLLSPLNHYASCAYGDNPSLIIRAQVIGRI